MLADPFDEFHLLLWTQPRNCCLNNTTQGNLVDGDEAMVIHVCKETHDKLTIHSICDATMTWDRITEIFDFESALEPRSEKASEWSD